jgi:hypothetical protein
MSGSIYQPAPKPPAPPLLWQPSSFAGYLGFGSLILHSFATQGMPTDTTGWLGFAGTFLASLAAIVTNSGGSVEQTGIVSSPPPSGG